MRVLAGKFKGRKILTPSGNRTRPTSVVTRKTIFDIILHAPWAPDITESRILDAFAGSGSLGFEALSRGARYCSFIEIEKNAFHCIRNTIQSFGLDETADVQLRSILKYGLHPSGESYDIVFVDPPYGRGLVSETLEHLESVQSLSRQALVVIETSREKQIGLSSRWRVFDERTIGKSRVHFVGCPAH